MIIYDSQDHGTLCRNSYEQSVHTHTMKINKPRHDGFPPQGISEARRGSAVFTHMLNGTDPLRGRPVGGSGVHRK
jgi:hypothetical protein